MEPVLAMKQTLLKTDANIDIMVSWKLAANEQLERTPAVLRNAIDQRFDTKSSKRKSLLLQIIVNGNCARQNKFTQRNKKEILKKDTLRISEAVFERCSVKKVKFTGKHLYWSLFFKKLLTWGLLILEGGLLVILIDCMIFLSQFLDVTRISNIQQFLSLHSYTLEFSPYRMLFFDMWS